MKRKRAPVAAWLALLSALAAVGVNARAESVAAALEARLAAHEQSRAIQRQIDAATGRSADPASALAARQLADALAQAIAQRDAEQARIDRLDASVAAREQARAALVPLLEEMLDLLAQSIERDLPVNLVTRRGAVAHARRTLTDASASAADRLAAVLAAYASERRLATSVDERAGTVMLGDPARQMRLVRVGRVALYAVTDDASACFVFDRAERVWQQMTLGQCARLTAWRADQPLDILTSLPRSVTPKTDGATP